MHEKPRVIIAGGSGFIGQALSGLLLRRSFDVVVLTRGERAFRGDVRYVSWDGKTLAAWTSALDGAAAVINLAGRNIDCRFTAENRRKILNSRIDSTRIIAHAIADASKPPPVLVQASATGYYGDSGQRVIDESAPAGSDFMSDVCRQWEDALAASTLPATRKVILRIGFVLGCGGGALRVLERLTRAYLGGAAGNGRQFVSWIHLHDLVRVIVAAIEREDWHGTFNATAPNPVTNAELMRELRGVLHRPWSPPVPTLFVHLGAWLMGSEGQLALQSFRVLPKRLLEGGFKFEYPLLRDALCQLFGTEQRDQLTGAI